MLDWLLTPLSGAADHHIAPWAYWHARAMVLAWAVLLPLGALVARFFKTAADWPRTLDHKRWWHAHRGLQYSGVALMTLGLALAWPHSGAPGTVARWHVWGGWAVCGAGWAQLLSAFWRGSKGGPTDRQLRGDHYDMTPWRRGFERWHKGLGWASLVLAIAVTALGLVAADAPRWMAVVLAGWWAVLGGAFWRWQRQGRCIDTYQAIWGTDTRHPGNQVPPTGWGVRRPLN